MCATDTPRVNAQLCQGLTMWLKVIYLSPPSPVTSSIKLDIHNST